MIKATASGFIERGLIAPIRATGRRGAPHRPLALLLIGDDRRDRPPERGQTFVGLRSEYPGRNAERETRHPFDLDREGTISLVMCDPAAAISAQHHSAGVRTDELPPQVQAIAIQRPIRDQRRADFVENDEAVELPVKRPIELVADQLNALGRDEVQVVDGNLHTQIVAWTAAVNAPARAGFSLGLQAVAVEQRSDVSDGIRHRPPDDVPPVRASVADRRVTRLSWGVR
jgi:hypothetical protein